MRCPDITTKSRLATLIPLILSQSLMIFPQAQNQIPKNPTRQSEIQRIAVRKNIARSPALLPAAKLNLVRQLAKGKMAQKTLDDANLGESITLDSRNGFRDNQAFLKFIYPEQIALNENTTYLVHNKNLDFTQSSVDVFINPPASGFYVFDFSVANLGQTGNSTLSLLVDFDFANIQTSKMGPENQHVLFATQINTSGGWHMLSILSPNAEWAFYSVEISRFK